MTSDMTQKLDSAATLEIRAQMRGLSGAAASDTAKRLAEHLGVSVNTIYNHAKLVRPPRKTRADKGTRTAELDQHPTLALATDFVLRDKLKPEFALLKAQRTAEKNGLPDVPVTLATFQRYLREDGLGKKQRRSSSHVYRPFEADAPGEIFQVDFTGLKNRCVDEKTRTLLKFTELEVSKNHPDDNPNHTPLWAASMVDDHSRYAFVRFYAVRRMSSVEVIDFLLAGFREMGIPKKLYTDKDGIILSELVQRAFDILNRALQDSGGFVHEHHEAGNPQATGKVERFHQILEEYNKLLGSSGQRKLTMADLNAFTANITRHANWRVHSQTGQRPQERFHSMLRVFRIPPEGMLEAAFKAKEFVKPITGRLTINIEGQHYQLPREAAQPFVHWPVNQKVKILWLVDVDFFLLTGPDQTVYQIEKKLATTDSAGEYKTLPETRARQVKKAVRAKAKEVLGEIGAGNVVTPFLDTDEAPAMPARMPARREVIDAAQLAAVNPALALLADAPDEQVNIFKATRALRQEGLFETPPSAEQAAWLKAQFAAADTRSLNELRAAWLERNADAEAQPAARLRLVS